MYCILAAQFVPKRPRAQRGTAQPRVDARTVAPSTDRANDRPTSADSPAPAPSSRRTALIVMPAASLKTAAATAAGKRMEKTGDVIPLVAVKKARKGAKRELPRVIYVGHVPHGFYEAQMKEYFGQFGEVTRVKVSRNKKTGKSKHYAFVEFKHPEVAEIVAESMNNYLLANQVLKIELLAPEKVHPKTFEGTGTKFKTVPWQRRAAATHNRERTEAETRKRNAELVKAEEKRRAKIAAAGIDYDFPGYKAILSTEKPKQAAKKTEEKKTPAKAKTPAKTKAPAKEKTPAKAKTQAKAKTSTKAKTPAKEEATPKSKDPTPIARKTRGAVKRANETPAKPAKKAKK